MSASQKKGETDFHSRANSADVHMHAKCWGFLKSFLYLSDTLHACVQHISK